MGNTTRKTAIPVFPFSLPQLNTVPGKEFLVLFHVLTASHQIKVCNRNFRFSSKQEDSRYCDMQNAKTPISHFTYVLNFTHLGSPIDIIGPTSIHHYHLILLAPSDT